MLQNSKVTPKLISEYECQFFDVSGKKTYLRAARALRSDDLTGRTADIEKLDIPTLIVWGTDDPFQPVSYGKTLANAMRDAQLEIIDDAGHFLPEDAPDTLGKMIMEFARL